MQVYNGFDDIVEERVKSILLSMGGSQKAEGFRVAKNLLMQSATDIEILPLKTKGYAMISQRHNKTVQSIEKNLSNFIERMWLFGDSDNLYEIFGDTVSEKKGFPTNKQFIMTIADKIKMAK